jgi:hypothetical protein
MRRSTLLIVVAIFAISGLAVSQVVVTNQGYATMQGAAVAPAEISPPLLTTPSINVTALPPAQMGISSNAVRQMGAISALAAPNANVTSLSLPSVGYAAPMMEYSLPVGYMPVGASNVPSAYAANTTFGENIDFGAGDISSLNPSEIADDGVDLVAVATAFKNRTRNTQRIYTNDDIHRLDRMPNSDISTVPLQPETLDQNLGNTANPPGMTQPQAMFPAPPQAISVATPPNANDVNAAADNALPNTAAPEGTAVSVPAVRPALAKPSPFVPRAALRR